MNWNPKRVTIATPKPARVYMSEPMGHGEEQPEFTQAMCGSSWKIRVRGDIHKRAPQLYRCRAGHEMVCEMPLSLVPDEIPCATSGGPVDCRSSAAWVGSNCGIGHAAGEVKS